MGFYGIFREAQVVYHLPKDSENFGQNVNGKTILARPTGKMFKINRTS